MVGGEQTGGSRFRLPENWFAGGLLRRIALAPFAQADVQGADSGFEQAGHFGGDAAVGMVFGVVHKLGKQPVEHDFAGIGFQLPAAADGFNVAQAF